jgi:regulator of protease activity HflC (stomatin/prohibitin superfamily)
MNRLGLIFSTFLVALALASSMLFVVDQRQFGILYALGQIKEVITKPGLNFKLPPPFQNVSYIDKRLLTLDSTDNEPMLTAEKQRVVIDWYVRWRISEPTEYIRNVGTNESAGASQLNRVVRNAFQEEINKRTVKELLSDKREALMADVKSEVLAQVRGAKPWGVDVIDVRITRVDYVDAITERMNCAQPERLRVKRFALMRIASGKSRLPTLTGTPRRSKARAMAKLLASMLSRSGVTPSLHSFIAVWMPTRPASTRRAMWWWWILPAPNFSKSCAATLPPCQPKSELRRNGFER